MILLIDNYDSFSYNLVQLAGGFDPDIRVIRNDEMTTAQIRGLGASKMILSPGPGYPEHAGVCKEAVAAFKGRIPILGVCLGHQAICEAFGARITRARRLMHGKKSGVRIDNSCPLFRGLPENIEAARYHSLIARRDTVPDELMIIAEDDIGEVMAVKHRQYDIYGLQFHPESVLTPEGRAIMKNFLSLERGICD